MKVLLLESGSISVKLHDKLAKKLKDHSHEVHCYMTSNANYLYNRLGENNKYFNYDRADETAEYKSSGEVKHISEVEWADVCLLAPADFNIIGKLANGIADDFVTSTLAAYLGTGKKLYIADAMNTYMWRNPIFRENRTSLWYQDNIIFIQPTVKALACGTTGIGALADLDTIVNILEGHVWSCPVKEKFPWNGDHFYGDPFVFQKYLPRPEEPGYFGAQRKYDRHEGVDIYCKRGTKVFAVEDGEVVDSYQYTGSKETGEWWMPTWCIKVQGRSGVVTYGELEMPKLEFNYPEIGKSVKAGEYIGVVGQVLKSDKLRKDIRNHSCSMLHLELRTENCHLDGWELDVQKDKRLLDPMPYLLSKELTVK